MKVPFKSGVQIKHKVTSSRFVHVLVSFSTFQTPLIKSFALPFLLLHSLCRLRHLIRLLQSLLFHNFFALLLCDCVLTTFSLSFPFFFSLFLFLSLSLSLCFSVSLFLSLSLYFCLFLALSVSIKNTPWSVVT